MVHQTTAKIFILSPGESLNEDDYDELLTLNYIDDSVLVPLRGTILLQPETLTGKTNAPVS